MRLKPAETLVPALASNTDPPPKGKESLESLVHPHTIYGLVVAMNSAQILAIVMSLKLFARLQ